jgi:hypothetical protein
MFRTVLKCAKSDVRQSPGMAELQRLLSAICGAEAMDSLDARALADIEQGVFNSGRPELISLYRRLLADVDSEGTKANKDASALRPRTLSPVRDRVLAFVANCVIFSRRITVARRNDHDRGGYQQSPTDYLN